LRGEPPQFEGFGGEIKLTNFWARVFSFFRRDSERYRCRYCGHVFTKEEVEVAGEENYRYGFHVHCPKCSRIVDQHLKKLSKC
jgi:uncharacterized protein with PIN domain